MLCAFLTISDISLLPEEVVLQSWYLELGIVSYGLLNSALKTYSIKYKKFGKLRYVHINLYIMHMYTTKPALTLPRI